MGIQAIAIPQKHIRMSQLISDTDLDLGAFALKTDLIEKSGSGLSILDPLVMNGEVDALLKTQCFTIVNSANNRRTMAGLPKSTNATVLTSMGRLGKVPVGAISGTLSIAATVVSDNASGIAYVRPWSIDYSTWLGAEQSVTGTTPQLKYWDLTVGSTIYAGEGIAIYLRSNNAAYTASLNAAAIRGDITMAFKAGTVDWS